MNCQYCGKPLTDGYVPITIGGRGKDAFRVYMHSWCFQKACSNGATIETLKKYTSAENITPRDEEPVCASPAFRGLEWGFVFTLGLIAVALVVRYIGGIL